MGTSVRKGAAPDMLHRARLAAGNQPAANDATTDAPARHHTRPPSSPPTMRRSSANATRGAYRARITSTLKQMMKSQLVDVVSAKTGREKAEVEAVLESVFGAIADALQANQRVDLRGFPVVSSCGSRRRKRQGRNPRTGETITIAAKRDASFKAGKELNEKLVLPKTESRPA